MILINDVLVDEKIGKTHFSCDLSKCKGACCTFPGEFGAPLLEEEIELLKESLPSAMQYLSEKSIAIIENDGFITKVGKSYYTNCIEKKDCVFVYYDGDIAFCSLEKAFIEGKTKFQKPVSCHLFPIRVAYFGGKYIYYENIEECSPALDNGKAKNVRIFESVKDALIRSYGADWFINYLSELRKRESE
ncbi:MAG: DUF3109 family protein [Candidatus Kapabacteria bacterium]|nr:DUF3109 family protein [Ignavibacteriota bacterium]MCW5883361.1 DUF3109 family protein [Candidatus Kapabacteria bacterium]